MNWPTDYWCQLIGRLPIIDFFKFSGNNDLSNCTNSHLEAMETFIIITLIMIVTSCLDFLTISVCPAHNDQKNIGTKAKIQEYYRITTSFYRNLISKTNCFLRGLLPYIHATSPNLIFFKLLITIFLFHCQIFCFCFMY